MKHSLSAGAAFAAMIAGPVFAQETYTVTVTVEGVRSDAGSVMATLCGNPQSPFCSDHAAFAPSVTGETVLTFTRVPAGRYALGAFHDENGDGQTQIPPEGFAFGNGATFPPSFEASSIEVMGDTTAPLTLTYIGGAAALGVTSGGSHGAPAPDGVERIDVREDDLYGELYLPESAEDLPGLILLGGSEGGIDVISSMAPSFAQQGYAVLALAYWGEQGLPQTLENIPLEYFDAALDWLRAQPRVDRDSIGALGWSRGSEAALLLAARNPELGAVAAIAPSGIVWQGLDYADMANADPAWFAGGEALPFMSTDPAAFETYTPGAPMTPIFIEALARADAHVDAQIPVERIAGPVLLISGGDDGLWPSAMMAERIVARLEAAGFAHDVQNLVYPEAGHTVFVGAPDGMMARSVGVTNAMMGGSDAANAMAWADNWPRALEFFDRALKGSGQ
jgi:dienelactone hydrolase/uncharacterized protein (DUF2141 family)